MTISRKGTPAAPNSANPVAAITRSLGSWDVGDLVAVSVSWVCASSPTITPGMLTQTGGTGAITEVQLNESNGGATGGGTFSGVSIWSFRVTTAGPITVTVAGFPSGGGYSFLTANHAGASSTVGFNASRVEAINSAFSATDGATAQSSGSATSAGEAWFVSALGLNNGAALTITPPSGFAAVTDNGAAGAADEVNAMADDLVSSGTTQAAAWTFTAMDGASYNAQTAALVVYKEATGGPNVSSTSSSAPLEGSTLTIEGTGFGASQGDSYAIVAGSVASVTAWSDTSVSVTVPPATLNKYAAPVTVQIVAGTPSNAFTLTGGVLPPAGWDYIDVGTPHPNPVLRIRAFDDIASGDQLAWDTLSDQVEVYADGTWSAAATLLTGAFGVKAWASTGGGWGAIGLQSLSIVQQRPVRHWNGTAWLAAATAARNGSAWAKSAVKTP